MVVARQDDVEGMARDQLAVVAHVGLDHADDKVGPVLTRLLRRRDAGFDRRQEHQIAGRGDLRRGILRHRDQRDLHAAHLFHHDAAEPLDRRAVGIGDVDRGPGVFRRLHLFVEILRPEIEFVVARHGKVERHDIGQVDGVLALVKARQKRGRQHVAIEDIKRVRIGRPLGARHRVQPGKAAAAILFLEVIGVADPEDGDLDGFGGGGIGEGKGAGAQKQGGAVAGGDLHRRTPLGVGQGQTAAKRGRSQSLMPAPGPVRSPALSRKPLVGH